MGQVFQLRDIQIIKLNYLHKSHTYVAGRFLLFLNFVHLKSYHEEHLTHKFSSSAEYNRPHFGHSASDSLPSRASPLRSSSTSSGPSTAFFACFATSYFFFSSFSFFSLSFSSLFSSRIRFLSTFSRSSSFFLCTSSFKPDNTSSSFPTCSLFWLRMDKNVT